MAPDGAITLEAAARGIGHGWQCARPGHRSACHHRHELAAYLEQRAGAPGRSCTSPLGAVDLALESPIARGGLWRERVRAALAELAHDFADHIALTESPGGVYDRIQSSSPRLRAAVDRLRCGAP